MESSEQRGERRSSDLTFLLSPLSFLVLSAEGGGGRIAQRESTCFTRKGSLVQIQLRPPALASGERESGKKRGESSFASLLSRPRKAGVGE